MDTQTHVLKGGLVFTIDFSQWSGRVRLRPEVIKGQPIIPPSDLASLGSLKIADPDDLNVFDRLKKKAHRAVGGVGVRFLGGYLVPDAKGDACGKALDEIIAEVEAHKATLRANYTSKMDSWIAKHPGWESEIRAAMLDANDAVNRFHFTWTAFRVVAGETPQLATNLQKAAGGLVGQLYREIADVANTVIDKSILGRDKANGRILLPLKSLREKLAGLEFLDPSVQPLVASVDHVLAKMPKGVPIEGDNMSTIYGLMLILSDTDRIKQHAEAILSGGVVGDLVEGAKPGGSQAAAEVTEQQQTVAQAPVAAATVAEMPAMPVGMEVGASASAAVPPLVAALVADAMPVPQTSMFDSAVL